MREKLFTRFLRFSWFKRFIMRRLVREWQAKGLL